MAPIAGELGERMVEAGLRALMPAAGIFGGWEGNATDLGVTSPRSDWRRRMRRALEAAFEELESEPDRLLAKLRADYVACIERGKGWACPAAVDTRALDADRLRVPAGRLGAVDAVPDMRSRSAARPPPEHLVFRAERLLDGGDPGSGRRPLGGGAVSRPAKETPEAKRARRLAAYERGWVDSLRAYDARSCQPVDDGYDYARGWNACADYRWKDPNGRGVAPDPNYRTPYEPKP